MLNRFKTFLSTLVVASIATTTFAAEPKIIDTIGNSILGGTMSKAACLNRAEATINGYLRLHGGEGFSRQDGDAWIVVGWNFEPGSVDVLFTCADAVAKDSIGNAYVSFHASGEDAKENIRLTRERLIKIWNLMG